jgi:hypothetical protein
MRLSLLIACQLFPLDLVPDSSRSSAMRRRDHRCVCVAIGDPRTGPDVLNRHWPGTPDGLRAIKRLAGLQHD